MAKRPRTSTRSNPDFGARLREERERLKLSQEALAEKLRVSRFTQIKYERAKRLPDGEYLYELGLQGADVGYVLFGERSTPNNCYALAASLYLPIVLKRAGVDSTSIMALLGLAAEDEAHKWDGTPTDEVTDDANYAKLIDAAFENGRLLGQIFEAVAKAMHDMKCSLSAPQRTDLVLTLYNAFKTRGRIIGESLLTAVKVACQVGSRAHSSAAKPRR